MSLQGYFHTYTLIDYRDKIQITRSRDCTSKSPVFDERKRSFLNMIFVNGNEKAVVLSLEDEGYRQGNPKRLTMPCSAKALCKTENSKLYKEPKHVQLYRTNYEIHLRGRS